MAKKVTILIKSAPFSDLAGQEALDASLVFGNFEQETSIVFVEDGVFHLLANHRSALINAKPYLDTYKALTFYGIETLISCQQSLNQRSIVHQPHAFETQPKTTGEIANFLRKQDMVLTF